MFSLRSLRESMAITSQALSRVAKDTPGLAALINTQTDITDILDPRIPYDASSSRRLLSRDDSFTTTAARTTSLPALQLELDRLNRKSDRRAGGSYAINYLDSLQPGGGGMPRTRKQEKLAAQRKVRALTLYHAAS